MNMWIKRSTTTITLICIVVLIFLRFYYSSSYARSWDAVDFALGVEAFNLLDMQPHFPGYPFFILGGMGVHLFVDDPTLSLSLWNVIFSLSSFIPMWFIFRRYVSTIQALVVIGFVQSLPFLNVIMTSPMSEGMAFTVMWWYIWAIMKALEAKTYKWDLLTLLFFSLLMGVRLSYLPLGVGLIFLWYYRWKQKGGLHVLEQLFVAGLFQLLWVYPLILSVGGFESFQYIASEFVKGHFTGWGGSIATEHDSFAVRLFQYMVNNIIWVGLSLQSGILLVLLGITCMTIRLGNRTSFRSLWIGLIGSYAIWGFFAQNVDKPRHILPVVVLSIALLGIYVFKRTSNATLLLVVIIIATNTAISGQYVKKQATELPATYQLAEAIEAKREPLKVYTWEEERVMDYIGVSKPYQKVQTYALFVEDANKQKAKGKDVYVTNRVVKGFENQGVDTSSFDPVERFESDQLFDPVYHKITLYKWAK